jgi:hypothetical protein
MHVNTVLSGKEVEVNCALFITAFHIVQISDSQDDRWVTHQSENAFAIYIYKVISHYLKKLTT